jgi:hypothetical protein
LQVIQTTSEETDMSIKRLLEQKARQAATIRKEAERLRQLQEMGRKLEARIRAAQKASDQKTALQLGTNLIRILRENAPGFFDESGQFDAPLLVGALLDAHGKLAKDSSVATKWTESGEKHFKKAEAKTPAVATAETREAPTTTVEPVVESEPIISDALSSVEDIFSGESK